MYITFKELRNIKHSLPTGSVARIANELNLEEQTVRNYFGAKKYQGGKIAEIDVQPGPDGGYIQLEDTRIIDLAKRIINNANITSPKYDTEYMGVIVKLDKDYDSFTEEDVKNLIHDLRSELKIQDELNLIDKNKGSVLLTLEMTNEEAEILLIAVKTGKLKELGVVDAKLKHFQEYKSTAHPQIENHRLSLNQYKESLIEYIQKDSVSKTISNLKTVLLPNTSKYSEFTSLSSRYNRLQKENSKGVMEYENYDRESNKITGSLLNFVNNLEETDLSKRIHSTILV